ncbi:MAG: recombinase family protein [Oscillospiraceae bacterium]|nr:recombinase family protein [Oscillospiraceae bacterium]
MKREWRVIAYVRLSDEDREKQEESRSIENQRKYLELYIESMKARGEVITEHTVISDDGKTGTDTDRTGFHQVIEFLRAKKYNCLLVSDLSRGFRNISDQTYYLEEYFPLHGIRFISTTLQYVDSFLLPGSAMNLGVKIQGITNEQFAYDTSVKIRSKFDLKRKLGEFIGAFAPYGYSKAPGNSDLLVVDPEAAGVVRDIFRWYTEDLSSMSAIVRKLNAIGIPNPTKYKNERGENLRNPLGNDGLWSASSVRRVLTNEVYLGRMVQGREEIINYKVHKSRKLPKEDWVVVEGTHEPVVAAEIFEKARQLLSLNVRACSDGSVYPLAGLLKCGQCRKAMSRKSSKGRVYYCCRTYREKGKQFCSPHSIREDVLFSAVLEAVNRQVRGHGPLLPRLLAASPRPSSARLRTDTWKRTEQALATELSVFDKVYYDYAKGLISQEQFLRIRTLCEKRQTELEALLESAKDTEETKSAAPESAELQSFIETSRFTGLTRRLAFHLIESVQVHGGGLVEVRFTFAEPAVCL